MSKDFLDKQLKNINVLFLSRTYTLRIKVVKKLLRIITIIINLYKIKASARSEITLNIIKLQNKQENVYLKAS